MLDRLATSTTAMEEMSWDTALAWINSASAEASPSLCSSPRFEYNLMAPLVIISKPEESDGPCKAEYAWLEVGVVAFNETRLGPFSVFVSHRTQPSPLYPETWLMISHSSSFYLSGHRSLIRCPRGLLRRRRTARPHRLAYVRFSRVGLVGFDGGRGGL